ncbi:MAG: alanine racemase [Candidatus Gracilibacteria bacterium]
MLFFRKRLKTLNRIEIIQENILHNYEFFRKRAENQSIIAVLKSNAYGHGIQQISSILEETDCAMIAVDSYYEAAKVLQHSSKKVLLIGYTPPQNLPLMNLKKVSLTVYDLETMDILAAMKKKVRIHLKINTGMNRQGLEVQDLSTYLGYFKKYPFLTLEGIFSHFADSDNTDPAFTQKQADCFTQALHILKQSDLHPKYVHLGATHGAFFPVDARINSMRIGIGLFGYHTFAEEHPERKSYDTLKPALRCISTVINTIALKKGDKVSYNGTFEAQENTTLAVIPFGYYEGLTRKLSNKYRVTWYDKSLQIAGRVCMNLTCLNAGTHKIQRGDEVTVISEHKTDPNSIDTLAITAKTINYEILVKLSETIRRVIV